MLYWWCSIVGGNIPEVVLSSVPLLTGVGVVKGEWGLVGGGSVILHGESVKRRKERMTRKRKRRRRRRRRRGGGGQGEGGGRGGGGGGGEEVVKEKEEEEEEEIYSCNSTCYQIHHVTLYIKARTVTKYVKGCCCPNY